MTTSLVILCRIPVYMTMVLPLTITLLLSTWLKFAIFAKLKEVGIPLIPHRAKQITLKDYDKFDYIIGMDEWNMRNLNRMLNGDPEGKVYKFLTFAGSDRDIADPWYTGNFDATYNDVVEGCKGLLEFLALH